jgi:hypothetical protein
MCASQCIVIEKNGLRVHLQHTSFSGQYCVLVGADTGRELVREADIGKVDEA